MRTLVVLLGLLGALSPARGEVVQITMHGVTYTYDCTRSGCTNTALDLDDPRDRKRAADLDEVAFAPPEPPECAYKARMTANFLDGGPPPPQPTKDQVDACNRAYAERDERMASLRREAAERNEPVAREKALEEMAARSKSNARRGSRRGKSSEKSKRKQAASQ